LNRIEFRQLRALAGLTQERAAQLLGVSHRTVLRWEAGDTNIDVLRGSAIRARFTEILFSASGTEALGEAMAKDKAPAA
jgi:transcriptional regulator with XRE-family HTH domain